MAFLNNFVGNGFIGIEFNQIINSVFVINNQKNFTPPPIQNEFLLLNSDEFLLLNGNNFSLLGD